MHDATRLHWDLRLEMDGRAQILAFPRAFRTPPTNFSAVKVEDHPLDTADFQGIIPEGTTAPVPSSSGIAGCGSRSRRAEDSKKGKLLFELRATSGMAVDADQAQKTKRNGALKERDAFVSTEPYSNESCCGLTNDELRTPSKRPSRSRRAGEAGVPTGAAGRGYGAMLAETRAEPFPKTDGVRG